jgi:hypothetical protein
MALPGDTSRPLTDEQRKLVEDNVALVPFVLRKYGTGGSDWDDAVGDGYCGLIRAAQRFDPTKARFSTYAVRWIRAGVQQGRLVAEGKNFRRAMGSGRGTAFRTAWHRPVSLDAPIAGMDDVALIDLVADDNGRVDPEVETGLIDRIHDTWWICRDQIDHDVLDAVVAGETLTAVARRHGMTPAGVSHRKRRVLGQLRRLSEVS